MDKDIDKLDKRIDKVFERGGKVIMSYYVPQRHYYILQYLYNDHGKTKKTSIKAPSIDITDDKFVIIRNRYNHNITISQDKVLAIEEVTENRSFGVITIILLVLIIVFIFYKYL